LIPAALRLDRAEVYRALRAENIGVNVHYIPVHMHAYYRDRFGDQRGVFPVAEDAYARLISLPIFAGMTERDVDDVIEAVRKIIGFATGPGVMSKSSGKSRGSSDTDTVE
jgi:perosamine synthetase